MANIIFKWLICMSTESYLFYVLGFEILIVQLLICIL